jgi:hypothetical protein
VVKAKGLMRYGVDTLPHVRCVLKKTWSVLGLVDKISPAFELRNSGVSAVVRSFQLSISAWVLNEQARVFLGCRLVTACH